MDPNPVIIWISVVVFIAWSNPVSGASFQFTNVKCENFDPTFSHFKECKLSVVRRGVVALNIYVELLKSPVSNSMINVALYKRGNGYNPYLFNKSADVCAYFADRAKYPVLHAIFSLFVKNTNLNHTCPYYDNMVVKDLVLEASTFALFPVPNGQYMMAFDVYSYKQLKGKLQVFVSRSD